MTAFAYSIGPFLPPPRQNMSIKIATSALASEKRRGMVSDEVWNVATDHSFRDLASKERELLDALLEASVPAEIVEVISGGLLGQTLMTKRKEALSSRFLRRNRAAFRIERDPASILLVALSYYAESCLHEERTVDTTRDTTRGFQAPQEVRCAAVNN